MYGMCNLCNICSPQAIGDVISSIGIGTAAADSIGRQHGIGLTLNIIIYYCIFKTKTKTKYVHDNRTVHMHTSLAHISAALAQSVPQNSHKFSVFFQRNFLITLHRRTRVSTV